MPFVSIEWRINLNRQAAKRVLRCSDLEQQAKACREQAMRTRSMAGMIRVARLEEAAYDMDFSVVSSYCSQEA
jgi:hypothetical protein